MANIILINTEGVTFETDECPGQCFIDCLRDLFANGQTWLALMTRDEQPLRLPCTGCILETMMRERNGLTGHDYLILDGSSFDHPLINSDFL